MTDISLLWLGLTCNVHKCTSCYAVNNKRCIRQDYGKEILELYNGVNRAIQARTVYGGSVTEDDIVNLLLNH